VEQGMATQRHRIGEIELKRDFLAADKDHDHAINFEEFAKLLEELGAGMSLSELRIGFNELDTDHDGRISYQEFADWWTSD
jgi:Ca2+-binding EF-hand superfamily protein